MAINDTAVLAVKGVVGGQQHVHTLHFRITDPALVEDDLIADYQAGCLAAYRGLFRAGDSPAALITAAQVCGTLPLRAAFEATPASAVGTRVEGAGLATSEQLPTWLAQVVSVRTASAGKSRRGRFYIGGLAEYDVNGNNLSTVSNTAPPRHDLIDAYITALTNTFMGVGATSAWRLVVHSHKLASVPGTQCQNSSTLVTGMIKRLALGSMKSRKPGSGS